MNEYTLVTEIKDKLDKQYNYFINTVSNPKELMISIGELDSKFNKPYLIHLTRQVGRTYDSEETVLITDIQYSLTSYIQYVTGGEYVVKFKNIRNLTFSIFNSDEIELVRFSLMDKEYALMNSLLTEEEYIENVTKSEIRIKESEELKKEQLVRVAKYQKYIDNRWLLIKEIKRFSDVYNLIFNKNKIISGLNNFKLKAETMVKYYNDDIDHRNIDNFEYLKIKREMSKQVISDIERFFGEVGYKQVNKRDFYF